MIDSTKLVHYYPLVADPNDDKGTNHGTAGGDVGYGVTGATFDGTGDYISLPVGSIPHGSNQPIAISFWVTRLGNSSAGGNGSTAFFGMSKTAGTDKALVIGSGDAAGLYNGGSYVAIAHYADDYSTGDEMSAGENHIVYSFDGTTEKVYLNNVEISSANKSYDTEDTPTIYIGNWDNQAGTNYWHNGLIRDLAIFNDDLTVEEIGIIYNSTPPSTAGGAFLNNFI